MARNVSILVGVPCTQGGVTEACLHSLLALDRRCRDLGWGLTITTRADGLVTRTRNIFATHVVRSPEYTHLLMIDSDMGFEPSVIERLVRSGHDVVGACVPFREVRWSRVRSFLDEVPDLTADEMASIAHGHAVTFERSDASGRTATSVDGFLPARFLGGALVLIGREALVRLTDSDQVEAYDRGAPWLDDDPSGWTFFDPVIDPESRNYLSEDYAFCHRWRAIGGTIWVDMLSSVTHHGMVAVSGQPAVTLRTAQRLADGRTSS